MTQAEITESIIGKRRGITMRIGCAQSGAFSLESRMIKNRGTRRFAQQGLWLEMQGDPQRGTRRVSFEMRGQGTFLTSDGTTLRVEH